MLAQTELLFYEENPRIYSIVHDGSGSVSQDEIEKAMCSSDHVRQLAQSIRANGGLIDPLIVHGERLTVFEGNSRLAAYRLLCRRDPIKWARVKCMVLPAEISEEKIFALLGEYHIVGRKDWSPFEQAGYLWRREVRQKVSADQMAQEMGLSKTKVAQLILVYQFMKDHDEIEPQKWSYYEEYLKSQKIKKARSFLPGMDEIVVQKIKSGEIQKATHVRDRLTVVAAASRRGRLLKQFLDGKRDLDQCYESAVQGGATNAALKKCQAFHMFLADPETRQAIKEVPTSQRGKCIYELDKIKKNAAELLKVLKG